MARLTRRAALAALGTLGAGSVLDLGYVLRSIFESPTPAIRLTDRGGGMMGGGTMGPGMMGPDMAGPGR